MFLNTRTLAVLAALSTATTASLGAQSAPPIALTGPGARLGAGCSGFGFGAALARDASGALASVGFPHVTRVSPESPAAAAGLAVGDTIVEFAGRAGNERGALKLPDPGTAVRIRIKRGATDSTLTMVVGRLSDAGESGLAYDPAAPAAGGATDRRKCAVVAAGQKP